MYQEETLRDAVLKLYAALAMDNASWVEALVAHGPETTVIGTDNEEWWVGYDRVLAGWVAAKAEYGGTNLMPNDIQLHVDGALGWAVDEPDYSVQDGASGSFRLTMIFKLYEADWKLIHLHASVAVPNEELGIS